MKKFLQKWIDELKAASYEINLDGAFVSSKKTVVELDKAEAILTRALTDYQDEQILSMVDSNAQYQQAALDTLKEIAEHLTCEGGEDDVTDL